MRYLCLDPGRKRIGVAVSDETGLIATPLATIQVGERNRQQIFAQILKYIEQEEAGKLIIGLPLHMNGDEGIEAGRAREFARQLGKLTSIPIDFMDERLTSVEAERIMQEVGVKREKRKAVLDARAAAIILQTYLDVERSERRNATPPPHSLTLNSLLLESFCHKWKTRNSVGVLFPTKN